MVFHYNLITVTSITMVSLYWVPLTCKTLCGMCGPLGPLPDSSCIPFPSSSWRNYLEFGVSHCMHNGMFSLGMYVSISNMYFCLAYFQSLHICYSGPAFLSLGFCSILLLRFTHINVALRNSFLISAFSILLCEYIILLLFYYH